MADLMLLEQRLRLVPRFILQVGTIGRNKVTHRAAMAVGLWGSLGPDDGMTQTCLFRSVPSGLGHYSVRFGHATA